MVSYHDNSTTIARKQYDNSTTIARKQYDNSTTARGGSDEDLTTSTVLLCSIDFDGELLR